MTRLGLAVAATLALLNAMSPASAQDAAADYPNRPVRVIVSVPAGGGVDSVTRIIAEKLQQKFGQPFVIENRGGAAGNVAAEAVIMAEPDGYTLMASQPAPITVNPAIYKKLNFDPTRLEPVAIMSHIPNVLLVRSDFPAKTAQEFLATVKGNPNKYNYASQGAGTTSHLTTELFMTLTGAKLVHVPYKGTAPALNDLVGRHVDLMFMELSAANKLHSAGNARILAVATDKRLDVLPEIPTMVEAGAPNFVSDTWNAITAPPKTPLAIVAKLNAAVNEILNSPDIKQRFVALNLLPGGGTPAENAKFIKTETQRWSDVVKQANIQAE